MKKNRVVTIVIVSLIFLFAILIILNLTGVGDGAAQAAAMRSAPRPVTTVRVTPVARDTIERTVVLNGEILARNQVTIFPTVGGRLVELRRGIGDTVNRGEVVAMIDPSRPGEVFSHSPVVSTVGGTVLNSPFSIGDTLSTQSGIFIVGDLSALVVETHVPERYVAAVVPGMRAQLRFEALGSETFAAEVTEINPVLDPASRTLRIRLRFLRHDPRIRAGMFATISLVTNRRADIFVVPRISAIISEGSWFVFVVDEENTAHRREVTIGIDNEDFIEILSGVSLGENVVSAGQNFITDGDLVRIVE